MPVPQSRRSFDGYRVRAVRKHLGLSQAEMARALAISVSYLSQIESGDRPITGHVLAALATHYPHDWSAIDPSETETLLSDVIDACSDPSVGDVVGDLSDIERVIRQHPLIARRLAALYATQRANLAQLRALDDLVGAEGSARRLPWEEVRDWFHAQQNYIDEIDRAQIQGGVFSRDCGHTGQKNHRQMHALLMQHRQQVDAKPALQLPVQHDDLRLGASH